MSQRFRTRKHCSSCDVSFDADSVHNCETARIAAALERIAAVMEFVPVLKIPEDTAPSICFHEDECTEDNCPCDGVAR